jgi:hypothetical protein
MFVRVDEALADQRVQHLIGDPGGSLAHDVPDQTGKVLASG